MLRLIFTVAFATASLAWGSLGALAEDGAGAATVYHCSASPDYSLIDIQIEGTLGGGSTYGDGSGNQGRYAYAADGTLTFLDGPYSDYPAYADRGKIYITTPGGSFYMTCTTP